MASVLSASHFHDEAAAYKYVEARVWPDGPVCPHCGCYERVGKLGGKSTRIGTYKCYDCRKPFTVKVGTIFESSHVKLHLWLQAIYLMSASKKGISSNQLHRTLGVTLKTAWFMTHRIREAMRSDDLSPMGSGGGTVEVDETFIGRKKGAPVKRAYHHKMKVLSLVDRETGQARSQVVTNVRADTIMPIVRENLAHEAKLMTDEGDAYHHAGRDFASHSVVSHGRGEYVRGQRPHQHHRGLFLDLQAWDEGRLPALRRGAICTATWPSSISATPTVPPATGMTPLAWTSRFVVSSAVASPMKRLVGAPSGNAEEEAQEHADPSRAVKAVSGNRGKPRSRWRTKPHRGK